MGDSVTTNGGDRIEQACEHQYDEGELNLGWGVATADCVICGIRAVMNADPFASDVLYEGEVVGLCAVCGLVSHDNNPNGASEVCFGFCFEEEE